MLIPRTANDLNKKKRAIAVWAFFRTECLAIRVHQYWTQVVDDRNTNDKMFSKWQLRNLTVIHDLLVNTCILSIWKLLFSLKGQIYMVMFKQSSAGQAQIWKYIYPFDIYTSNSKSNIFLLANQSLVLAWAVLWLSLLSPKWELAYCLG